MGLPFIWFVITLAVKLTIRIIGRGEMVGIYSERGEGWKNFAKLIMLSPC